MLKSYNMIELLLMLLKEDGNILRNMFKIILLLNTVIYVTFAHVLIKILFTITNLLFYNFYKDSTSNYLVLIVFILFSSYISLLDIYGHLKCSI